MGINMKKLGITTSKYVALLVLTLTNMPIAYATDIKASIEQGKAEAYYKETVNDQKESVIPDASNLESKKQNQNTDGKTTTEQTQEEKHDLRLPNVTETKSSQEEEALKAQFGEPILVNGQEQIYKKDETNFITYISGDVKTYKDDKGTEFPIDLNLVSDKKDGQSIFKPNGSPVEVVLPEKVDNKQEFRRMQGQSIL